MRGRRGTEDRGSKQGGQGLRYVHGGMYLGRKKRGREGRRRVEKATRRK